MLVGMWKSGSVSGKVGEVCEELRKRMTDVCFLQVRWRGGLEKDMHWWCRSCYGEGGAV